MKRAVQIFPLLVALFASPAFAQQSARKDFDEFCQKLKGRWIGSVTWVADWPGVGGKKGDKVTAYFDVSLEADGNALLGRHYGGDAYGIWMVSYDVGDKAIKGTVVNSSGGVTNLRYFKKDGKWMESGKGTLADGRKTTHTSEVLFDKDDDTMILQGAGTLDNEDTDRRHDVYRRVQK